METHGTHRPQVPKAAPLPEGFLLGWVCVRVGGGVLCGVHEPRAGRGSPKGTCVCLMTLVPSHLITGPTFSHMEGHSWLAEGMAFRV